MDRKGFVRKSWASYCCIFAVLLLCAVFFSHAVTTAAEYAPEAPTKIVIDAGHGGEDGGATSCTGVLESAINLEIALRLEDMLHLLGYDTVMIRTTDRAVYTTGDTIALKKVSDLKERVRIVNETPKALLVSIHQNQFTDARYSGAQVFYADTGDSRELASAMQSSLVSNLNPGSRRKEKKAGQVYLMNHIDCTGILIECGFLSNAEEEAKLRDPLYQKQICCVVAVELQRFLNQAKTVV